MYWVTSRRSVWVINKCTFQNNYLKSNLPNYKNCDKSKHQRQKRECRLIPLEKNYWRLLSQLQCRTTDTEEMYMYLFVFFTPNLALSPSPILARFFAADEITCVWVCLFYRVHILWYLPSTSETTGKKQ